MKIANNIIGNILGKPRVRGGKNDWDGDGVLNRKDCQPRNTMRQDRFQVKPVGKNYMIYDSEIGEFVFGYNFPDEITAIKVANIANKNKR